MNVIHLKKGFSPRIVGAASRQLRLLDAPGHVGMVPEPIPFIKPRLLVEVDDDVSVGSPLFEDKRNPGIKFLSPGSGKIASINFGPRRIIREIVINLFQLKSLIFCLS